MIAGRTLGIDAECAQHISRYNCHPPYTLRAALTKPPFRCIASEACVGGMKTTDQNAETGRSIEALSRAVAQALTQSLSEKRVRVAAYQAWSQLRDVGGEVEPLPLDQARAYTQALWAVERLLGLVGAPAPALQSREERERRSKRGLSNRQTERSGT